MTRQTLILGFICSCCLLQSGNAALNDRTKKLLESQATNRPSTNGSAQNSNAQKDINARPSYGPTHGVFDPPSGNRVGAGTVPPGKR